MYTLGSPSFPELRLSNSNCYTKTNGIPKLPVSPDSVSRHVSRKESTGVGGNKGAGWCPPRDFHM